MSVLVVGADGALRAAIASRLLEQGDEVRAIEIDAAAGARLRELGVHVAKGRDLDPDLVERAAQNVRTLVVVDPEPSTLSDVIEGARFARVDRLVLCGGDDRARDAIRSSGLDHVILRVTVPRGIFKKRLDTRSVAEAVDAADDLAGNPRLDLDLSQASAWTELGLAPR